MSQKADNIFTVAPGNSFPRFVEPGASPVLLGADQAADAGSLVAKPGFDAVPSAVSVARTAAPATGWKLVNGLANGVPAAGAQEQFSIFVQAVRGPIVETKRVVVLATNSSLPTFPVIYFNGADTVYVTAGGAFAVAVPCGFQSYFTYQSLNNTNDFQPFTVTPNAELPPWITATMSAALQATGGTTSDGTASTAQISLNLTGTAPATLGTYAFNVTSTGAFQINPHLPADTYVTTDSTRLFVVVVPPDALWTLAAYTAAASAGTAFGWAYGDKVFAGSAVTISAGPAWLQVAGGTVMGTPPVNAANTNVTVTLLATLQNVTQTATLTINIGPPVVDLWAGTGAYTANAIEGQPFSWSSAALAAAASDVSATNQPAWLYEDDGVFSGTPPAGTGGSVIVVDLSASKAGSTSNATLTITIALPLAPMDFWIGDPFTANAVEGLLFAWALAGKLATGATGTLGTNPPAWLSINAGTISGTPPTGSGNSAFVAPLVATSGGNTDATTLTITIATPPPPAMFTNAPYTLGITEGRAFTFQIAVAYSAVVVTASDLPPWLIFQADTLTFTGMAPLGSGGGPVIVVGLSGTDGTNTEETTLTITVSPLAVLGVTLDLRNNAVTFDGGKPVFKHGDSAVLVVTCIPADQAGGVTGLKARIKEDNSYQSYGQLLYQASYAQIGTTNSFQFAAITFASDRLDHALALLDPIEVDASADFMLEFEYGFNGLRKTSQVAEITIERDFALDTSAGGTGATGGDAGANTSGGSGAGSGAIFTFTLQLAGNVTQGQSFGYFVAPAAMLITAVSLDIQAADAAAGLTARLVDGTGTAYGTGYGVTVAAATANGHADFSSAALALAAGSIVRGQVTSYVPSSDPSAPAQILTLQVVCRQ